MSTEFSIIFWISANRLPAIIHQYNLVITVMAIAYNEINGNYEQKCYNFLSEMNALRLEPCQLQRCHG